MALQQFLQGFSEVQDRKLKAVKTAADERFRQSELELEKRRAEQEAQRLTQQAQQQAIMNQFEARRTQVAEDREKREANTAKVKAEAAQKSSDALADYRAARLRIEGTRLSLQDEARQAAIWHKAYHDAMAQHADEGIASQIATAEVNAAFPPSPNRPQGAAPQPIDPQFLSALSQAVGASKSKAQLDLEAKQSLIDLREAQVDNTKETLNRIKKQIEVMGVEKTLKEADIVLRKTQAAKNEQEIKQKEKMFDLKMSDLALSVAEKELRIEEGKIKLEVDKAMKGAFSERDMSNPKFRSVMKNVLHMRMDAVGKTKTSLQQTTEKEHEHLNALIGMSQTPPFDKSTGRAFPQNSQGYREWDESRKPNGLLTKDISGSNQHLAELNRQLANVNREYDSLEVAATDPDTGWILPTGADGKPDMGQAKTLHEAAKKRAIDSANMAAKLNTLPPINTPPAVPREINPAPVQQVRPFTPPFIPPPVRTAPHTTTSKKTGAKTTSGKSKTHDILQKMLEQLK